jgi:hypothetical protein
VLNSRVKAVSSDAVTVVDKADQVRSGCLSETLQAQNDKPMLAWQIAADFLQ